MIWLCQGNQTILPSLLIFYVKRKGWADVPGPWRSGLTVLKDGIILQQCVNHVFLSHQMLFAGFSGNRIHTIILGNVYLQYFETFVTDTPGCKHRHGIKESTFGIQWESKSTPALRGSV